MKDESRDITTDLTEIKGTRKILWKIDTNKLDNLDKMDKFLGIQISKTDSRKSRKILTDL